MIAGSLRWFIDRPAVANLLAMILLLGGLFAIPNTRQETLPNVPLERIGIVSSLPGAAPQMVEQRLCMPIETAVYGVEGISGLRSESREGRCSITVDVMEGFKSSEVRDAMAARVDGMTQLPPDASRPRVEEVVFRNRVARLLLAGEASPLELHRTAWQIRSRLLADPAITDVVLEGLPEREIAIELDRQNLHRYQLTFDEVAEAIRRHVGRVTGGLLRESGSSALLQTGDPVSRAADYGLIPVRRDAGGERLHLEQVASIHDGFSRDAMASWLDGQPAVALDVYLAGGQNVLDIADAVSQLADRVGNELAAQGRFRLLLWEDDADQYRQRTSLLRSNALQGLLMLIVVLGVFLGLRLAVWVGAGIPVAMLGACMILPLAGESFNTISLFAFILVLGIVLDDAVIVGESCEQQVRRQGPTADAIEAGTRRVAGPIVGAVITTMLAFSPMLFLPGPEGEFMRVVPLVAMTILALSLVECLWILPAHLRQAAAMPPGRSERFSHGVNQRLDGWIESRLPVLLAVLTRWRYTVLAGFAGLFFISLALLHSGWLSVSMFSHVEGDKVVADVTFPEGSSSQQVLAAVQQLQASARALADELAAERGRPAIGSILVEQGRRDNYSTAYDPNAHLRGRVTLQLLGDGDAPAPTALAQRWQQLQPAIHGATSLRFHSSLNEIRPDIHINLFHDDLDVLEAMGHTLAAQLGQLEGVYNVANSMASRFTEVDIRLYASAQAQDIAAEQVGRQVQSAFQGLEVDRLPQGDHDVPVMLRLPAEQTRHFWHLEQLPITLADGTVAPLDALARLDIHRSPAVIGHFDRQRSVTVTAYVDERQTSPGRVMGYLQDSLLAELPQLWPGAHWGEAGKPVAVAEFLRYLLVAYGIAIVAMFFVMTLMFGNYIQPLLVLLAIPFGMVGAILGHGLLGQGMTLWSVVGIVAVSGVVVNDNLVLIDRINHYRGEQVSPRAAVAAALKERFRPIMLTTLTTFLAVAPLAFETSTQAAFLVPMAISLGFGVLFASIVTLLLVPALYLTGVAIGQGAQGRFIRPLPSDSVEQAYGWGLRAASGATNPYQDEVLRASWEAGMLDQGAGQAPAGQAP